MRTNYPERVMAYANAAIAVIEEDLKEGNEIDPEELREALAAAAFSKFLIGEEIELDQDEMERAFNVAITQTVLNSLSEKGLIDSIENEEGKDIFFLTPLGKEVRKEIIDNDSRDI